MGLRFRKSFRLIPGVRLNLSKSGASVSVGGRGITTNINKKGTQTTVGIPGSGLSYTTARSKPSSQVTNSLASQRISIALALVCVIVTIVIVLAAL